MIPTYIRSRPIIAELEKALGDAHQSILTEAAKNVKDEYPEIKFSTRLERGRPPDVIVEVGIEEDVDLIVMGSRGTGGVSALVLGSTSRHVVETWIKPIIIIR